MRRSLIAEGVGTALLLAAVVGSGIMAERLSGGNNAIALLANAIATGAALYPLILSFDGLSGAHFNPAVSLVMAINGELRWRLVLPYALVQTIGGLQHAVRTDPGNADAAYDLEALLNLYRPIAVEEASQLPYHRGEHGDTGAAGGSPGSGAVGAGGF